MHPDIYPKLVRLAWKLNSMSKKNTLEDFAS